LVIVTASAGLLTQSGGVWSWTFDVIDGPDDSQVVTISATDSDGFNTEVTFQLNVNNVAPEYVGFFVTQGLIIFDTMTIGPVSFVDASSVDTHTALLDWGDGTSPEFVTVTPSSGTGTYGTVSESHVYDSNGFFEVTVALADDDGDGDPQTFYTSRPNALRAKMGEKPGQGKGLNLNG
jgi:hypothetical protein